MQCSLRSAVLGKGCNVNVIVPQNYESDNLTPGKRREYKVLYLLHGLSDDYSSWLRRTSIERYLDNQGVVAVMPDVDRSFYTDMKHGLKYWTFISEELPALIKQLFPVSSRAEDTYVAGLSMGGYGAFKLAFNHPERFAAAASFSGSFENRWLEENNPTEYAFIFGKREDLTGSEDDLMGKAKALAESGKEKPRLYMGCGTEDFLYSVNVEYRDMLQKLGYDLTYNERPGVHNWAFWDTEIQTALEWMFKDRK